MKIIFKSIIVIIGLFILSSCDSFLDEDPVDRYTTGNFYQSEEDAKSGVTAVYENLYSIYDRNILILNALISDDEKNGIGMPNQFLQNLEYLKFTSENPFIEDMWSNNYAGISRANTAIQNIPEVPNMKEEIQKRLIGEAKFLRALYYFNLVRYFGDIPLILELEEVEDAYIPRSGKDEVYNQIISDLKDAESTLPKTLDDKDLGRASSGAAKILLGKVYLTMHNYQESADKLSEVIDNEGEYGFGLHFKYEDNWRKDTQNGVEAVFAIQYIGPPGRGNNLMTLTGPKYSMPGGFEAIGWSDGNEADIPTEDLYSQFDEQDERRDATLRTDFKSLDDGSVHVSSIPLFVKYTEDGQKIPQRSAINVQILRYSDALLMYAESLNEIGKTGLALEILNRIRERAFQDSSHNYDGLGQEEFREAVWQERRLELAYEGHRWFDLVRTGRFVDRMKAHSEFEASLAEGNKVEIGQNVQDYMTLLPIPQRELDLNPELTQNEGY